MVYCLNHLLWIQKYLYMCSGVDKNLLAWHFLHSVFDRLLSTCTLYSFESCTWMLQIYIHVLIKYTVECIVTVFPKSQFSSTVIVQTLVDWFLTCLTDKYCKSIIMTEYYNLCDHLDHRFSRDRTFRLRTSLCLPVWSFIMMVSCCWLILTDLLTVVFFCLLSRTVLLWFLFYIHAASFWNTLP